MTLALDLLTEDELYPSSDGKPMAENTEQYRWIVTIKENLEILFQEDAQVFIAADLLWYPVKSPLIAPTAPDTMVVFGRPKGRRSSYRQWREENQPPQVVFEILSESNRTTQGCSEMIRKFDFYQTYGVEEYYIYDPDLNEVQGWQRWSQELRAIELMDNWVSPRLGIRFVLGETELALLRPDGRKFLTSVELDQRATQADQRAEQQFQRAEQEKSRAERLAQQLRALEIEPEA